MRWVVLAVFVASCGGSLPTPRPAAPECARLASLADGAGERCFWQAGDLPDERSRPIYDRLCELGHARGCVLVALRDKAKLPRAEFLLQRDCDGDDMTACESLAGLLEDAEAPDAPRIAELHARALAGHLAGCAAHSARACYRLAFYYRGEHGLAEDRDHMVALLEGACRQGVDDACDRAGDELAQRDVPRAVAMYQRGCELGKASACAGVAGLSERTDVPRAIAAWQRACDLGRALHGCGSLAELLRKQPRVDLDRVMKLYRRSCDAGGYAHCFHAALIAERRGEGIARTLYTRACDAGEDRACKQMHFDDRCRHGDDDGCAELAKIYFNAHERSLDGHALDLLTAACTRGSDRACGMLGQELDEGNRVPRDLPRAIPLLDKGCDVVAQHCRRLWRIYTHGEVPRDPVKAKEASDRACALDASHCP